MPVFFIEYPFMIIALLIVVPIEYNWQKASGFKLAPVLWANLASTFLGIPLSYSIREFIAIELIDGSNADDPFRAGIYMGAVGYEGSSLTVLGIILIFNYTFSVLIEWVIYRLFYKSKPPGLLFKQTLIANAISYGGLSIFFFGWGLLVDLSN